MGRLGHKRKTIIKWCQVCGEISGTCSHTRHGRINCAVCGSSDGTCVHIRPDEPQGRSPTWGMFARACSSCRDTTGTCIHQRPGNVYPGVGTVTLLGQAELVGRMPLRSDIEVLPADEPGWQVRETVGIAVVNPRGVSRLAIDHGDPRPTRDNILEIIRHSLSQFLIEGILVNTLNVSRHTYLDIQEAMQRAEGEVIVSGLNLRVSTTVLDSQLLFAEERPNRATTFYPVEK